jgi:hypothetical protein
MFKFMAPAVAYLRSARMVVLGLTAFTSLGFAQPAAATAVLFIDTTTAIKMQTSGFLNYNFTTQTYSPALVSHSGGTPIAQGTFNYATSDSSATLDTSMPVIGLGMSRKITGVPNSFYFRENGNIIGLVTYNFGAFLFGVTDMHVLVQKYGGLVQPPSTLLSGAVIVDTGTDFIVPTDPLYDYSIRIRMGSLSSTPGGAVPEPSTWLMLLAGFGMVGMVLRRGASRPIAAAC